MPAYKDNRKGTWYVKFRYTDWQGNRKETTKRGFATKREAKEYEEEYKRKIQGTADMTLNSLFDIFHEDCSYRLKENTVTVYKYVYHRHISPTLGNIPISKLTPNTIRQWQNKLQEKESRHHSKLSSSSIWKINQLLSTMLNFAVKFYGLPKNPMKISGTQGRVKKRIDFWSEDEYGLFMEKMVHPICRPLFQLLYLSGMRIREALALTMPDVNFSTNTITVNKTLSPRGNIQTPKTQSSNRVITMPSGIMQEISYMHDNLSYATDKLFPISYNTAMRQYTKAVEAAGIRHLPIHCLRHAHASMLIAKGVPITAVSKRLGHVSPQVTLSVYAHAEKDSDKNIAALLETI